MSILTGFVDVASPTYQRTRISSSNGRDLSRLISAAVVNRNFCQKLLDDPQGAVATGYQGEIFSFEPEELSFISAIRASSLADFASQISAYQNNLY